MKMKQYKERQFQTQDMTFYKSVKKLLIVGKIMGFVPIVGLFSGNSKKTRGTWKSPYTLYYIYNTVLRSFVLALLLINMASSLRLNVDYYQNKMDILITSLALFLTIHMSIFCKNWRGMIDEIERIERLIPKTDRRRRIQGNRVIIFMFTMTILEHIIYTAYTVQIVCVDETVSAACTVRGYFEFYYDFTFNVIPFSYLAACVMQISKIQRKFLMAFIDAMIVSVTLYLMNRFKDFNSALSVRLNKCNNNKNVRWSDIQAYYTRLAKLVRAIDDKYTTFIFVSFFVNLVYICKNIYVFIHLPWIEATQFFIFNISILVKALITFTSTAYLHTLTREPLNALHTIPATAYNPQFQRFMDQVFQSKVHLSGLKMFNISRNTILSVISTVITYELVLIQLPDSGRH